MALSSYYTGSCGTRDIGTKTDIPIIRFFSVHQSFSSIDITHSLHSLTHSFTRSLLSILQYILPTKPMVLYIIGLGLGDEKDITVRGLETVKKCSAVFLEFYTSMLGIDNNKLVRTHSLTHSLTHCLSHSFTASLTHCITH